MRLQEFFKSQLQLLASVDNIRSELPWTKDKEKGSFPGYEEEVT